MFSPMLFMEMGACYYPEIGFDLELEPMSSDNKPEAAVVAVALGALENSACMCQFADREITIPEWVELFNCVAGMNWNVEDMMKTGRRIFYLQRLVNHGFGVCAKDDVVSSRLLTPATDGAPEGIEINFEEMKRRFYELMDLDPISECLLRKLCWIMTWRLKQPGSWGSPLWRTRVF